MEGIQWEWVDTGKQGELKVFKTRWLWGWWWQFEKLMQRMNKTGGQSPHITFASHLPFYFILRVCTLWWVKRNFQCKNFLLSCQCVTFDGICKHRPPGELSWPYQPLHGIGKSQLMQEWFHCWKILVSSRQDLLKREKNNVSYPKAKYFTYQLNHSSVLSVLLSTNCH